FPFRTAKNFFQDTHFNRPSKTRSSARVRHATDFRYAESRFRTPGLHARKHPTRLLEAPENGTYKPNLRICDSFPKRRKIEDFCGILITISAGLRRNRTHRRGAWLWRFAPLKA